MTRERSRVPECTLCAGGHRWPDRYGAWMEERGCEEERLARYARSRLAGMQVLLVDDDIFQVAALRDLLFDHGLAATIATSGAAALECIEIELPDAVVLDVRLPGCHGLELLARLRARGDRSTTAGCEIRNPSGNVEALALALSLRGAARQSARQASVALKAAGVSCSAARPK